MHNMENKPSLDVGLHSPLPLQSRKAFIEETWGCDIGTKENYDPASAYFRHQEEHRRLATYNDRRIGLNATYQDIIDIIRQIHDIGLDRATLKTRWQEQSEKEESDEDSLRTIVPYGEECLDSLVDLAVSLWILIPTGGFRQVSLPGTCLDWQSGHLAQALTAQFERSPPSDEPTSLGKIFNARNLEQIGGIRIIWTSNLADHLRVQDDPTRVSIFHHATFLKYHQQMRHQVFPPGLVGETLQTLALLLPCHDKKVKAWYQKETKRFNLDADAAKGGPLKTEDRQLGRFVYWRDRLEILKDVFDDAEPRTIFQWWQDRRRRVQWYTFWVAVMVLVLTVFFGVIQCVEGGIQVYKAYNPT